MSEARTEEPTRKRLAKARAEGDSGSSAFASQAVGLVVAALVLPAAIGALFERAGSRIREAIAAAADVEPRVSVDVWRLAGDVALLTLPALAAVAIAAAASQLVQTGGIASAKRIAPRLSRLDPFAGGRGLLSRERLFGVTRAAVGAAIAAWVVAHVLRAHLVDLARLSGRFVYVAPVLASLAEDVARDAAMAGMALAVVDLVVVRGFWRERLRMSRREVERERRESEGDPRLKQARLEMLAASAMGRVRNASVVVTGLAGPTPIACAIRYDERESAGAPVVLALGRGELAEQVIREARTFGVAVVEDAALAEALVELEIDDSIPENLYEAAAAAIREAQDLR